MIAKPSFRPVPCNGGWQIKVTWPDARTEHLSGYPSEADAIKWINNVSDKWAANVSTRNNRLHTRNGRWIIQIIAARLPFADG